MSMQMPTCRISDPRLYSKYTAQQHTVSAQGKSEAIRNLRRDWKSTSIHYKECRE